MRHEPRPSSSRDAVKKFARIVFLFPLPPVTHSLCGHYTLPGHLESMEACGLGTKKKARSGEEAGPLCPGMGTVQQRVSKIWPQCPSS